MDTTKKNREYRNLKKVHENPPPPPPKKKKTIFIFNCIKNNWKYTQLTPIQRAGRWHFFSKLCWEKKKNPVDLYQP